MEWKANCFLCSKRLNVDKRHLVRNKPIVEADVIESMETIKTKMHGRYIVNGPLMFLGIFQWAMIWLQVMPSIKNRARLIFCVVKTFQKQCWFHQPWFHKTKLAVRSFERAFSMWTCYVFRRKYWPHNSFQHFQDHFFILSMNLFIKKIIDAKINNNKI